MLPLQSQIVDMPLYTVTATDIDNKIAQDQVKTCCKAAIIRAARNNWVNYLQKTSGNDGARSFRSRCIDPRVVRIIRSATSHNFVLFNSSSNYSYPSLRNCIIVRWRPQTKQFARLSSATDQR
jgi:hypothetical protein